MRSQGKTIAIGLAAAALLTVAIGLFVGDFHPMALLGLFVIFAVNILVLL